MENKRFQKNDEGFVCENCGKEVTPLSYSSRNHCPHCLWSIHADINPGDRESACRGKMRPKRVEPDAKKGYIITHKCLVCGEERRCRAARDDDKELLISLTVGDW